VVNNLGIPFIHHVLSSSIPTGPTYRERTSSVIIQYLCDVAGLKGMENELLLMQDIDAPQETGYFDL
jgi:hypothetical protein